MRKGLALFASFAVMLAGAGAVAAATAPAAGVAASEEVLRLADGDEEVGEQEKLDPDKEQNGGMTCCWTG
jgi:hypothetical protein